MSEERPLTPAEYRALIDRKNAEEEAARKRKESWWPDPANDDPMSGDEPLIPEPEMPEEVKFPPGSTTSPPRNTLFTKDKIPEWMINQARVKAINEHTPED